MIKWSVRCVRESWVSAAASLSCCTVGTDEESIGSSSKCPLKNYLLLLPAPLPTDLLDKANERIQGSPALPTEESFLEHMEGKGNLIFLFSADLIYVEGLLQGVMKPG